MFSDIVSKLPFKNELSHLVIKDTGGQYNVLYLQVRLMFCITQKQWVFRPSYSKRKRTYGAHLGWVSSQPKCNENHTDA